MSEFRFSVSQLLQEPTGASRRYELDDPQLTVDETLRVHPVKGQVRLTRTPKGVLANVEMRGNIDLECSRCLTQYQQPLALKFSEEYYQTYDVTTGARLPEPDEEEVFLIDEAHKLDLGDSMREYVLLNLPAAGRCREDCKGLCAQCGANLNEGECACEPEITDDRMAALAKLLGETST